MKKIGSNLVTFISKYNIPICIFGLYVFLSHSLNFQNCLIKWLIGYPCPGCGMTRAVLALAKLDFSKAFFYNPFVFLLPLLFLGVAFQHIPLIQKIFKNKWIALSLILLVGVGYILRFIYIYPKPPMDFYEHNLLSLLLSFFS